jgi:(p)ppGpp synthase/HD superfamily hydrolase
MGLTSAPFFFTSRLEEAFRFAAAGHHGQVRKLSGVPYLEHVVAVAWILDHAGFEEDVVVAGLLHDLVEDTPVTVQDLEHRFGKAVADLVAYGSEVKTDALGKKRPWIDRKRDHLAALAEAPVEARAVVLADKLHNLVSIELDLRDGHSVWSQFNASRAQVFWYYEAMIARCGNGDRRLEQLANRCRALLQTVRALDGSSEQPRLAGSGGCEWAVDPGETDG